MDGLEQRFGVDRSMFTAIRGVEPDAGGSRGSLPLLDPWVTRARTERRPPGLDETWRKQVRCSLAAWPPGHLAAWRAAGLRSLAGMSWPARP